MGILIKGNEWPRIPLYKEPTELEVKFNQILTRITEALSDGKLTNISILDLPAFGAKIDQLEKDHQISPIWPTEMNFAIHNSPMANMTNFFNFYKTVLDHWKNHMATLRDATDPNETFTNLMLHNEFMNFTKFIKEDMRTYLLAVSGKISYSSRFLRRI